MSDERDPEALGAVLKKAVEAHARRSAAAPSASLAIDEEFSRLDRLRMLSDRRGIDRNAATRRVVYLPKPEPTEAVRVVAEAWRWRNRFRLPTGEAPGCVTVLAGGPGSGKTCAGSYPVPRLPSALVVTASAVAAVPPNDYSPNRDQIAAWAAVPYLFIDECGMELQAKAAQRVLSLTFTRFNQGMFTVLGTNLSAGQFVGRYFSTEVEGEAGLAPETRLVSRLEGEQQRGVATGGVGLPWWYDLPSADMRMA